MQCAVDVLIVVYDPASQLLMSYKSRESCKFLEIKGRTGEDAFTDKDV